jgi:hypothetical protein
LIGCSSFTGFYGVFFASASALFLRFSSASAMRSAAFKGNFLTGASALATTSSLFFSSYFASNSFSANFLAASSAFLNSSTS